MNMQELRIAALSRVVDTALSAMEAADHMLKGDILSANAKHAQATLLPRLTCEEVLNRYEGYARKLCGIESDRINQCLVDSLGIRVEFFVNPKDVGVLNTLVLWAQLIEADVIKCCT